MSQPSTPFTGAAVDPWMPSMNQTQHLSHEQLDDLLSLSRSDQPVFPSNSSDVLDSLDFSFHSASFAQIDSSNPSTISTPDFTDYSFGPNISAYPPPGHNSPHPYPLEVQHSFLSTTDPSVNTPSYTQRLIPFHAHTNAKSLQFGQPPPDYTRRRSLSHGDVDRFAATNSNANPTFIRLQAPRARSATPEEKKRASPYSQHGRSASQGVGARGRPMKIPSTLQGNHGSQLVGGMMLTSIGTPLNAEKDVLHGGLATSGQGIDSTELSIQYGGPDIRHMTHPQDLARSRQIIEIGAIAVRKRHHANVDPMLELDLMMTNRERILSKLEELERYLRQEEGGNLNALRGCRMIRMALEGGAESENRQESIGEDMMADTSDVPSMVFVRRDYDLFDSENGHNELMALLMQGSDCGVSNSDKE